MFRQIDRAHHELTDEQVQNLAIISRLQQGQTNRYLDLIDDYLKQAVETLPLIQENYRVLCQTFNDFYMKSLAFILDELDVVANQALSALTNYPNIERSNKAQKHVFAELKNHWIKVIVL